MASLVALPAVTVGTAMAVVVPLLALKEALEKRSKKNFKKHLARRSVCRVHFGEGLDDTPLPGQNNKKNNNKGEPGKQGAAFMETASNQSAPPAYNELFARPPPPYGRK